MRPAVVFLATVFLVAACGGDPVYFHDDFSDSSSGWAVETKGSASMSYSNGGWLVDISGSDKNEYFQSPYGGLHSTVTITTKFHQLSSDTADTGGGIECVEPGEHLHYYFKFEASDWTIARVGEIGVDQSEVIHSGKASSGNVHDEHTLVARCALSPGSHATDITFSIDGRQMAQFTDTWDPVGASGWTGGLVASSSTNGHDQILFTAFTIGP